MKTLNYNFKQLKTEYNLSLIADPYKALFVDIETTGLSPDYASIYLMGCCFYEKGEWMIRQWLCEKEDEEKELLKAFYKHLSSYSTLIHFNGNQFDLPFIQKRAALYDIPISFDDMTGIDIYKRIFPYRHFLRLTNCKQKTLEEYLGINREDEYSGGELIRVYKQY